MRAKRLFRARIMPRRAAGRVNRTQLARSSFNQGSAQPHKVGGNAARTTSGAANPGYSGRSSMSTSEPATVPRLSHAIRLSPWTALTYYCPRCQRISASFPGPRRCGSDAATTAPVRSPRDTCMLPMVGGQFAELVAGVPNVCRPPAFSPRSANTTSGRIDDEYVVRYRSHSHPGH